MRVVNNSNKFHLSIFDSEIPGPTVCIVGGVHGDETCGLKSIAALEYKLTTKVKLLCGRLVMLRANLEAVRLKKRYVDFDLNRAFGEFGNSKAFGYESDLAKHLEPHLTELDYVLDLHSTSAPTRPFCSGKLTERHFNFFQLLGLEFYTHGWEIHRQHSMLIDEVDRQGGVGIIAECGKTGKSQTEKIALETTFRLLESLNMLDKNILNKSDITKTKTVVCITEIIKSKSDSFSFTRSFDNFDLIDPDEIVAYDNNVPIFYPNKFLMSMPTMGHIKLGDEAFGIGVVDKNLEEL
jgi:uncharacterized protein